VSTEKRRGASYLGFVGWWLVRGVARQIGLDVRAQARRGRQDFHTLMHRRLLRLPAPTRGLLLGVGVTVRAGYRLAHHGGRSLHLAWRHAMTEGSARHAEWVERREHPRGSTGRDHVVERQRAERAERLRDHREYSDEVHSMTRTQVLKAREDAVMKRLQAAKTELAAARARKDKPRQKRLTHQVELLTARLTRAQAAKELGLDLPAINAAAAAAAATSAVAPPPAAAAAVADPVVTAAAVTQKPTTTTAAPKAGTPASATVTALPTTTIPTVTPPTGPVLNGTHNQGGTTTMTAPTMTPPTGEVTTIDQALGAYERAVGGLIQVADEQGQAASAAEEMVALFEQAAGTLNLDDDSGSEIAAAMEQLRHVAELTKSLAAAAADAAGLLSTHQKALDTRYAFREQVAALRGGDAMPLASLRAS
jgi:hypothetical protein